MSAPFQLFSALDAATEAALRESIQRFAELVRDPRALSSESGVFIVEGESPYELGAAVYQVLPTSASRAVGMQLLGPRNMTRAEFDTFMRCRGSIEAAA